MSKATKSPEGAESRCLHALVRRLGRAHYVCEECNVDVTMNMVLLADIGEEPYKPVLWACPCGYRNLWAWAWHDADDQGPITMICDKCRRETECLGDGNGFFSPNVKGLPHDGNADTEIK